MACNFMVRSKTCFPLNSVDIVVQTGVMILLNLALAGWGGGEKVNPERSYIITFWIFKTNLSIPLLWLCLCVEVGWGQVCGANTNIHIAKLS